MPPLASPVPPQEDLFRHQLNNLLDSQHELYRLAHQLPWGQCVERFDCCMQSGAGPGLPIRLFVGLQYLKHLYARPDEEVVARWMEIPF